MQRKVVGEEIAGILDSKMPREIADEVIGYVVSGRVAEAFRSVVKEIEWGDAKNIYYHDDGPKRFYLDEVTTRYRCGVEKTVTRCKKCGTIEIVSFDDESCLHEPLVGITYWCCEAGECSKELMPEIDEEGEVNGKLKVLVSPACVRMRVWKEWTGEWRTVVAGKL